MQKITNNKKIILYLLMSLVLLAGLTSAYADEYTYFRQEDQVSYAKGCLTEVYGYTAEEANLFVYQQTEQDGIATLNYWHPDFPDWIYTNTFSLTDGRHIAGTSPFRSDYHSYPGENSVRYILTQVQEKQLLTNWNKEARESFRSILEQDGLRPSAELDKGLMTATYTAQEALRDYFITCYGAQENWPKAVGEWYQWLVETYQLEAFGHQTAPDGITRYRRDGENPMVLTEFIGSTPPELAKAMDHPMLDGWKLLSGATVVFQETVADNSPAKNRGLIALGKDEERMLCLVQQADGASDWTVSPISKTVLSPGCQPVITRSDPLSVSGSHRYQISFATDQYADITLQVALYQDSGKTVCRLTECRFTDTATGNLYQASEADSLYQVSCISQQGEKTVSITSCSHSSILTYMDIESFFEALQNPQSGSGFRIPEGMAVIGSVHLRKETSSHSRDLGTLNAGTLARIISIEPGDPHPWYQVEIGTKKGFVSGAYVEENPGRLTQSSLPVAITSEACSLKKNTDLFAPEVMKLSAGTTMHIIMSKDGWHYVCIPRQQPAGMWMDHQGTYGYIRAGKVTVGTSALELEWEQAGSAR